MLLNRKLKRGLTRQQKQNQSKSYNFNLLSPLNSQTNLNPQQLSFKQSLVNGINHPRIRQLILNHQNLQNLLSPKKSASKENIKNGFLELQMMEQRKWLTKKGKKYLIDFDDNQRKQMKNCFNSMDPKKNGSIGVDELQQLLISVGLMNTRQEVKQLIDSVDEDKSGKIEFAQFLKMILNDEGQNEQIVRFFKYVINFNNKKNQQVPSKNTTQQQQNLRASYNSCCQSLVEKIQPIKQRLNCSNNNYFRMTGKPFYRQEKNKILQTDYQNQFNNSKQNSALNIFQKHPHPKNLPFGMIVSHIRRKHMLTALKIGPQKNTEMNKKSSLGSSADQNKTNHYISSSLLKSSTNMKDSKISLSQAKSTYTEEQILKGQNVMNNLKKMWDRRLLRQIRQRKSKKLQNLHQTVNSLTQKGKNLKSPHLCVP